MSDGVKIHFFPSSFIINDKKWQLEKDGEISFSKSLVSASDVKFIQGNQQIKISTGPSSGTLTTHDIVVKLSKVNADDITSLINLTKPKLEGEITGTITIQDPFGKPFIEYDTKNSKDIRVLVSHAVEKDGSYSYFEFRSSDNLKYYTTI